MTTMRKKDSGTFTAPGASNKVHGHSGDYSLTVAAGTTVQLRKYPPGDSTPVVVEEFTEGQHSKIISSEGRNIDWDFNCSVYGADSKYNISVNQ